MRLASFEHAGRAGYGVVRHDRIIDLAAHWSEEHPDLLSLVATLSPALIKRIEQLIAYIPTITELLPGDVVEVEISGIGMLRNPVAQED